MNSVVWLAFGFLALAGLNGWFKLDLPYSYFELLRLTVTTAFVWLAWKAHKSNQQLKVAVWVVGALVFNPIRELSFDENIWQIIDLIGAGLLAYELGLLKKCLDNLQTTTGSIVSDEDSSPPVEPVNTLLFVSFPAFLCVLIVILILFAFLVYNDGNNETNLIKAGVYGGLKALLSIASIYVASKWFHLKKWQSVLIGLLIFGLTTLAWEKLRFEPSQNETASEWTYYQRDSEGRDYFYSAESLTAKDNDSFYLIWRVQNNNGGVISEFTDYRGVIICSTNKAIINQASTFNGDGNLVSETTESVEQNIEPESFLASIKTEVCSKL